MAETKFHITDDGPKKCTASVKDCPIGGVHFEDNKTAQEVFEKSMEGKNLSTMKKEVTVPSLGKKSIKIESSTGSRSESLKDYLSRLDYLKATHPDPYSELDSYEVLKKVGFEDEKIKELFGDLSDKNYYNNVSVDVDGDGYVQVRVSGIGLSWGWEEGMDDHYEAEDYVDSAIAVDPRVSDYSLSVAGYYGEESEMVYDLKVPDEARVELTEIVEARNALAAQSRRGNPSLPEWGALPLNASMDGPPFQKFNKGEVKRAWGSGGYSTRIGEERAPKEPSTTKYDKAIEPAKEIRRVEKLVSRKEGEVKKLEEERAILSTTPIPATKSTGKVTKTAMERRKSEEAALDKKIEKEKASIEGYRKSLDALQKITPEQSAKAAEVKKNVMADYEERKKDFYIKKLSHHFPSNDEAVRMEAARKWVGKHPEIVGMEWNSGSL